jgi:anti-anti-sigma factor
MNGSAHDNPDDSRQRVLTRGPLTVISVRRGNEQRIRLVGELDLSTKPILEEELGAAEHGGAERLVLDLAELEFIDSSGIRTLLEAVQRSRRDSDRLVMTRPGRIVERTLRLTGVVEVLPFVNE